MVELRDYQRRLLHQVQDALGNDPKARVMMQLPTGGGKTEIAAQLLKNRLTDGRNAVWMTHRRELTEQTCERLIRADVPARVEKSWKSNDPDAPAMPNGVTILMAQTLGRRTAKGNVWSKYGPNDLMIVDEAHHAPAAGWERSMEQWPGQVLGMTATPWRLTKKEGFDHLFGKLICGPQIAALQRNDHLCKAKMIMPPPEDRIRGGDPVWDGDYNPSGIEQANSDRPEVMTARALKFWQEHAEKRQTIVYAVSVGHARILEELFKEEGVPAGSVLGATNQDETERNRVIEEFKNGSLKVIINVVIVTEGFDLPYASCIVMARPTLSLALFMQMVGRGLRPKAYGGDCLILDIADNSKEHGLPQTDREWSLKPRGSQSTGEAPIVWCVECGGVSHAASHRCEHCENPLGEDCKRCHRWRAAKRWSRKKLCGDAHDLVCDLCHADAHVRARLPVLNDLLVPKQELLPDERPPVRLPYDGEGYWWRGHFWRQSDWATILASDNDFNTLSKNGGYWHLLSSSLESQRFDLHSLLTPEGTEIPVYVTDPHSKNLVRPYRDAATGELIQGERSPKFTTSWKRILFEVADWLSRNERLPKERIPIRLGRKRYVVHTSPEHSDGKPFEDRRKLLNGLYIETQFGRKEVCKAVEVLNSISPPHEQFYVLYEPFANYDPIRQRVEICHHPQPVLCKHPVKSNMVGTISPTRVSQNYTPIQYLLRNGVLSEVLWHPDN